MACPQAVQRPIGVCDDAHLDHSIAVYDADRRAHEADPHGIARPVELLVAGLSERDVVHAPPRHRRGHEFPHQQPRDRSVPVGKMIDVGLAQLGGGLLGCRHRDARKSRIGIQPAVQRRKQVGRQPEEVASPAIEIRDRLVGQAPVATQELRIGDLREIALACRVVGKPRQVDAFARVQLDELATRGGRDWKIADEGLDRPPIAPIPRNVVGHPVGGVAGDEPVGAESLAVKKTGTRQTEPGIQLLIEECAEALDLDAELAHEGIHRRRKIRLRRLQRLTAAVADQQPVADTELVAARMTAKFVVVVEDEDARIGPESRAVVMCGGQAADPGADHDAVVLLLYRQSADSIAFTLERHRVRGFKRAIVLAA